MRNLVLTAAALFAATAVPAAANVTVQYNAGSGILPTGSTIIQDFESYAPGASIGTNATVFSATTADQAARPAYGSTGNFGAVLGSPAAGAYSISFVASPTFSFVLGSLDTYNTLTLFLSDLSSIVYQGGQITQDLSFPSGDQISGETNGVVTYTSTGASIIGATFQSTSNSFEFDNLAISAAPEPATWAMMILGFGAVGGVMRRRRASVPSVNFA